MKINVIERNINGINDSPSQILDNLNLSAYRKIEILTVLDELEEDYERLLLVGSSAPITVAEMIPDALTFGSLFLGMCCVPHSFQGNRASERFSEDDMESITALVEHYSLHDSLRRSLKATGYAHPSLVLIPELTHLVTNYRDEVITVGKVYESWCYGCNISTDAFDRVIERMKEELSK